MTQIYDAIVVGGSFAGLSAAMQLVRARRPVLMVDAGQPRNRFSAAAHGFLGQDGIAPAEIRRIALAQLQAYPSFELVTGLATNAVKVEDLFQVALDDGRTVLGKRLILAIGVTDELPAIEGLAPLWGKSVLHCPYCHGYEIGGGPIGVLASSPLAAHQGMLLPDWGPTTVFVQPGVRFSEDEKWAIEGREARIETVPVARLLTRDGRLTAAELEDGRSVPIDALFVQTKVKPASDLAERLGAAMEEGPQGPHVKVEAWGDTSVPGLFAAGDAASPMHNASFASAAGVKAGISAHRSLVMAGE